MKRPGPHTDESPHTLDRRDFRRALGTFATGVTIVTTRRSHDEPIGLTVNSFGSLSLEPPLVLWSLSVGALSLPAFNEATHFAVHVLTAEQRDLSNLFSKAGEDKFAGLELEPGLGDVPLLPGCAARFQCRIENRYEGGDHVIVIGRVEEYEYDANSEPLLFCRGGYAVQPRYLD